jgi:hypothetical protein
MAQVVNFHDAANGQLSFPGVFYYELFAGQGAYSDPGNDIWNGFGFEGGYSSTYFYSGTIGGGGPWPQEAGNPGNPYAAYNSGAGWVSSTGSSVFTFATGATNVTGDATSSGQFTPVTLSVTNYEGDNGIGNVSAFTVPNGSPSFLLGEAAYDIGPKLKEVFTLQNVPPGTYGLYLYGADYLNERGTLFQVSSGAAHNGIAATLNNGIGTPAQSFAEGQNFVIFENVTPNSSSNIIITASPNPLDGVGNTNLPEETYVNGFQLIFSPPPTAVGSTVAQNVWAGGTASFSFSPAFVTSPTYQWKSIIGGVTNNLSDSATIAGATTTNLTITGVSSANVGLYQCAITSGSSTGTSPAAPLTILTSTATGPLQVGDPTSIIGNVLEPGDTLIDVNSNTTAPYNSIPPPFDMTVLNVEDNTLYQYVNFGSNGSVAPFSGPSGFIVTPHVGATVVTGIRLFASSSHPEDDPSDFFLEGSNDQTNFTAITGGLLTLPAPRNAAGGPINITNEVLQEIDFANATAYSTYRLTFTNVNDNDAASNGVQLAEVQILGSLPAVKPGILQQPTATDFLLAGATLYATVVADGAGPVSYQWYYNSSTAITGATNATLTLPNLQTANNGNYTCTISNPYGSTNSTSLALTVIAASLYESTVLADAPLAFWPLNETSGITAYDVVGGYDGGYSNAPTLEVPGPSSYIPVGVTFDGMTQFVFIPNTPALDFGGQITLEAWVLPDASQPSGTLADIIAKGYDGSQNDDEIQMRVQDSTYFFGAYYSGSDTGVGASGGVVTTNWSHIVLTWDGAYWNIYQNGVLVGKGPDKVGLIKYSDPWAIADGTTSGDTRFYGGNISAAAIYSHALTPAQVTEHYNIGAYGTTNVPPIITEPSTAITNAVDLGGSDSIVSAASGPPTISYQWYYSESGVSTKIIGATNSTLALTDIQEVQTNYDYYVVASNPYGSATSSVVTLTVLSGPPTLVADINPLLTEVPVGIPVTFSVTVTGTEPFFYQWSVGGAAIAGATSSIYTFDALPGENNYSVTVSNTINHVSSSMAAVVGYTNAPPVVGFNDNGPNWTLNQGAGWPGAPTDPNITNDVLTLTDGTNSEACSAFFDTPQYIGGFIASYIYTASGNRAADGTTFCMEDSTNTAFGVGADAVGEGGGALGYFGISNSAAFELNLYAGANGGIGIQFATNGSTPDTPAPSAPYFYPGLVDIAGGDPISVQLFYSQNVLHVSLVDTTAGTSFATTFNVANLPAIVGGSSAFVGFTSGDGGANAIQKVANFVFSSTTPPILSVTRGAAESVVVSWPVSVSSLFVLQASPALSGPWSDVSEVPVVVDSLNQVTLTPGTSTAFYRLIVP